MSAIPVITPEDAALDLLRRTINGDSDIDHHLLTLFGIALSLRAKNILELGVRDGNSTRALVAAAYLTGGKLTSVDIQPTNFRPPDFMGNAWDFWEADAIEFLKLGIEQGSSYDLVLVDDDHRYPHVKQELQLLPHLIGVSGVILVHDLMANAHAPAYFEPRDHAEGEWAGGGPCRAVRELPLDQWEWATIPINNGLTILRKKL